jgi:hypothetical protein
MHKWDDIRWATLRRIAIPICTAALAVAFAACGSDGPSGPAPTAADTVAGTFTLSAIDSKSIPATILTETGYTLQVIASTAVLDTSGKVTLAINTRENVAGNLSVYVDSLYGSWTQSAGVVTLMMTPGLPGTSAGWDGRTISVPLIVATASGAYVFSKDR